MDVWGDFHADLLTWRCHSIRALFAIGYVTQDDVMLATLTVHQTLTMYSRLNTTASVTDLERKARVETVIDHLGLRRVEDTIIGNTLIRGISGGERRRVSIGIDLVRCPAPALLLLDEPTSGLSSTDANKVREDARQFQ